MTEPPVTMSSARPFICWIRVAALTQDESTGSGETSIQSTCRNGGCAPVYWRAAHFPCQHRFLHKRSCSETKLVRFRPCWPIQAHSTPSKFFPFVALPRAKGRRLGKWTAAMSRDCAVARSSTQLGRLHHPAWRLRFQTRHVWRRQASRLRQSAKARPAAQAISHAGGSNQTRRRFWWQKWIKHSFVMDAMAAWSSKALPLPTPTSTDCHSSRWPTHVKKRGRLSCTAPQLTRIDAVSPPVFQMVLEIEGHYKQSAFRGLSPFERGCFHVFLFFIMNTPLIWRNTPEFSYLSKKTSKQTATNGTQANHSPKHHYESYKKFTSRWEWSRSLAFNHYYDSLD